MSTCLHYSESIVEARALVDSVCFSIELKTYRNEHACVELAELVATVFGLPNRSEETAAPSGERLLFCCTPRRVSSW